MIVKRGEISFSHKKPSCEMVAVEWAPDGTSIACGSNDGDIIIIDVQTWTISSLRPIARGYLCNLSWAPDSRSLIASYQDGSIIVWNSRTGEYRLIYHYGDEDATSCCAWSPYRNVIASSSWEQEDTVQIQNPETGSVLEKLMMSDIFKKNPLQIRAALLRRNLRSFGSLAWSPNEDLLAIAQGDLLHLWQPETAFLLSYRTQLQTFYQEYRSHITKCAWSPDGHVLAFAYNQRIEVWNKETQKTVALYHSHAEYDDDISTLAWLPDGECLLSVGMHSLHYWNTRTGICFARSMLPLEGEKIAIEGDAFILEEPVGYAVLDATLSPDRRHIAFAGTTFLSDGTPCGMVWIGRHNLPL